MNLASPVEMKAVPEFQRLLKEKMPVIVRIIKKMVYIINHQLSQRRIKLIIDRRDKIFLEVGAGDKRGENGWVTLDMSKNCDIYWDLRKGIPCPDKSIAKIYSSHFLEHLSFREGQIFLDECLRTLVPNGIFSICVPNARLYIEAYMNSATLNKDKFFAYKPAYNNTTKIDYVNFTAYMDGHHKYMFDEENLIYILQSKGFKNVHIRDFDHDLDLKKRDFESIYAEAEK